MAKKERIDVLLVDRGLIETREKAKRSVMAGLVFCNNERVDKPGAKVDQDAELLVKGDLLPYVSRGGLKLEKAIEEFQFDLKEKIVLDIGSSTGGFTDCALQNGAKLVYAVDVGYNQLAWKLRQDERVVVMERTNFRYVTKDNFTKGLPNFATIDVSFISLRIILPALANVLEKGSHVSALVKPQFEAGREEVGKKGIVRDERVHRKVLEEIVSFSLNLGFDVRGLSYSPIKGGEGNIEFLLHLYWTGTTEPGDNNIASITELVSEAHHKLKQ
ncbi:TlyA family RNA methyltransferase [Anaerobacillus sp. CMMVII]|uniref:TlyA family RNA methyltransferase n=1 Tax=Anaerobacillus sp. CMMVII TaxID=2755588 RepID=UPI0021B84827|nr:TlyA family RNA methyltransferase [Anaerobacillus sp. CMMVII]MCT8138709.1 TlyA family RNA methyltransferase [Anaerobacillus sp. CMMVII]